MYTLFNVIYISGHVYASTSGKNFSKKLKVSTITPAAKELSSNADMCYQDLSLSIAQISDLTGLYSDINLKSIIYITFFNNK